jgi:hypothetical protein
LAERGPLAYWSQQAIEAAHKILKEAWSHSTAHDGGKTSAGRSIEQIMLKAGRICLGEARRLKCVGRPAVGEVARRSELLLLVNRAFEMSADEKLSVARVRQTARWRLVRAVKRTMARGRETVFAAEPCDADAQLAANLLDAAAEADEAEQDARDALEADEWEDEPSFGDAVVIDHDEDALECEAGVEELGGDYISEDNDD